MFPEERHVKIVKRIDELEADLFRIYKRLERLRLDLQREWRVLPSGDRWSESANEQTRYSESPADAAVDPHVTDTGKPTTRVVV